MTPLQAVFVHLFCRCIQAGLSLGECGQHSGVWNRVNSKLTIVGDQSDVVARQAAELGLLLGYSEVIYVTRAGPGDAAVFVATIDRATRDQLAQGVNPDHLVNLVHPDATVSPTAILGRNIMVGAQALVGMNARVGDFVVQNGLSSIEHDNQIGAHTFLGTGAILCGNVVTGEEAFVGAGATVKPGTVIGPRTTIGTGAVLVKDAEADAVYVGNPARKIR